MEEALDGDLALERRGAVHAERTVDHRGAVAGIDGELGGGDGEVARGRESSCDQRGAAGEGEQVGGTADADLVVGDSHVLHVHVLAGRALDGQPGSARVGDRGRVSGEAHRPENFGVAVCTRHLELVSVDREVAGHVHRGGHGHRAVDCQVVGGESDEVVVVAQANIRVREPHRFDIHVRVACQRHRPCARRDRQASRRAVVGDDTTGRLHRKASQDLRVAVTRGHLELVAVDRKVASHVHRGGHSHRAVDRQVVGGESDEISVAAQTDLRVREPHRLDVDVVRRTCPTSDCEVIARGGGFDRVVVKFDTLHVHVVTSPASDGDVPVGAGDRQARSPRVRQRCTVH